MRVEGARCLHVYIIICAQMSDIYIGNIHTYIKCKILTFVKQCSIHRNRAMYILWEERYK